MSLTITEQVREQIRLQISERKQWTPNEWALFFSDNNVKRWEANVDECALRHPAWRSEAEGILARAKAQLAYFQQLVESERQVASQQKAIEQYHSAQAMAA